ncbi:MAG: DUF1800 domain-containing protein [Thiolinea sp.]
MNQQSATQFLMTATLGADQDTMNQVKQWGIEPWLEQQLSHTYRETDSFLSKTREIWQYFRRKLLTQVAGDSSYLDGNGNPAALPYWFYWRMAWWHKTLTADPESLLRHRIAQALSEILVISDQSNLQLDAEGMASFYDLLYQHAFGHYDDLLTAVSLHPCMGTYLSHMNNQKADPGRNIHPDENYAREIMQLFTIGLFELNTDGSRIQDSRGNDIPTYNNNDIRQLARVFTGLQASRYLYEWPSFDAEFQPWNGYPVAFDDGVPKTFKSVPYVDMISPMATDDRYHDQGNKTLLHGRITLPANQTAQQDIQEAVKALVAHPNTAPFIVKKLIQQLVTSNPSPAYIRDVVAVFGVRGNLKAVVRAILTHPEAGSGQKLKPPLLRATQILRSFNATNRSGKLWVLGEEFKYLTGHHVLSSPTVFNFYLPDYVPHGPLDEQEQLAPEFQLHTANQAVNYTNLMYYWFFGGHYPSVSTVTHAQDYTLPEIESSRLTKAADKITLNLQTEEQMAANGRYDELIDRISLMLTGSTQLSGRQDIKDAFLPFTNVPRNGPKWVVQTILFMISISPEFTVLGGTR